MGMFDGLKTAKVFEQGEKLPEGTHLVKIEKIESKKSNRNGQPLYIVEYICMWTDSTAKVGKRYSWVQDFKDNNVALPQLKQFIFAVLQVSPEKNRADYDEAEAKIEEIAEASCAAGYLNGQFVEVTTKQVKTKSGQDFLRHTFKMPREDILKTLEA
jgi:hypothetical protein